MFDDVFIIISRTGRNDANYTVNAVVCKRSILIMYVCRSVKDWLSNFIGAPALDKRDYLSIWGFDSSVGGVDLRGGCCSSKSTEEYQHWNRLVDTHVHQSNYYNYSTCL